LHLGWVFRLPRRPTARRFRWRRSIEAVVLNVLLQLEIERLSDDVGLLSASSTCEIPQAALCVEQPKGCGLVQARGLPHNHASPVVQSGS
jgi:hypothetical protein